MEASRIENTGKAAPGGPSITKVELGSRSYDIHIGDRLLPKAGELINKHLNISQAIILSDEHVAKYYLHRLTGSLATAEIRSAPIILPPGEKLKSWQQLEKVIDDMLEQSPDRRTAVIALGGGVIGDLAGLAASLVLRGLPLIQMPTSLLAQVDSSVGGKTGINTHYGKNTVGTFYQPSMVMIDTSTLQTLAKRELLAGYAEILKYGLIYDAEFYAWLMQNGADVVVQKTDALNHAISTSCRIKAEVVAQDETEQNGMRAWLNFGHTYGHALELDMGYSDELLHGEAVAIGMVLALKLSAKLSHAPANLADEVAAHLKQMGMRVSPMEIKRSWNMDALMNYMSHDKKAISGELAFVLLDKIGHVWLDKEVPEEAVREVLQEELR